MMKKVLSIILTFALSAAYMYIPAFADDNVVYIYSEADLMSIADNPGYTYELMRDISTDVYTAIPSFSGKLNGNGHNISLGHQMLFNVVERGAVISDLGVSTIHPEYDYCGVIAGRLYGTIQRCDVQIFMGNYRVDTSGYVALGGIVGSVSGGRISDCYVGGNIYSNFGSVGGVAGIVENSVIERCYSEVYIEGSAPIAGGFAGNVSGSKLTDCYINAEESGQTINVAVGSDTVTELDNTSAKQRQSYSGFDFDNTWSIFESISTPYIKSVYGSGTEADPYKPKGGSQRDGSISNLCLIEGTKEGGSDKYYRMECDMSYEAYGIGGDDARFNGKFDGNGHVIENLEKSPLFGAIGENGVVKNVTFISSNVDDYYKTSAFGCVAGINYGTIENCHVLGNILGVKDAGGIVGENIGGTITRSSFSGTVSADISGAGGIAGYNSFGTISECSVDGNIRVNERGAGGIVGDNSNGLIENCVVYGSNIESGSSEAGGVAGRLYNGTIRGCYVNQNIRAKSGYGAAAGSIIESGTVENCYYNSDKTEFLLGGTERTDGALSNADTKIPGSFAGFDFNTIWTLDEDGDLALLSIKGAGTQDNPYKIRNQRDWIKAGDGINYAGERNYYELMANLYINSSNDNIFHGSLNGNAKEIYFYKYNDASRYEFSAGIGSGGYVGNAVFIKNGLGTVTDAKIEHCVFITDGPAMDIVTNSAVSNCAAVGESESLTKTEIDGGFVNQIQQNSTIENCVSRNKSVYGSLAGGFAGSVSSSKVINCHAYDCEIQGGSTVAGGFAGRNDNASVIENCGSTSKVYVGNEVSRSGVFVGMNYADINKSYAFNAAQDEKAAADFAGVNEGQIAECGVADNSSAIARPYIKFSGADVAVRDTTVYVPQTVADTAQNVLSDISGHWAETTINNLVQKGVINGYEDGTFRPENSVTKAEYIKLLMKATKQSPSESFTQFEDVNTSWAREYICRAFSLDILDNINSSDTVFGAEEPITRAQAAAIMGRQLAPDTGGGLPFTDSAEIPGWAAPPIAACVNLGLINGNDDGTFKPNSSLTRAEAATIIERVMNLK